MVLGSSQPVSVRRLYGPELRMRLGSPSAWRISQGELCEAEAAWKRAELVFFNLILTAAFIVALVMSLASSAFLWLGTAIACWSTTPIRRPSGRSSASVGPRRDQRGRDGAGRRVLMGVLNGRRVRACPTPSQSSRRLSFPSPWAATSPLSSPFHQRPRQPTCRRRRLRGAASPWPPRLRPTVYQPADWLCLLMARPSFPEPPGSLHLPADGQDRDHSGSVSGLHLQMVHGTLRDLCQGASSNRSCSST